MLHSDCSDGVDSLTTTAGLGNRLGGKGQERESPVSARGKAGTTFSDMPSGRNLHSAVTCNKMHVYYYYYYELSGVIFDLNFYFILIFKPLNNLFLHYSPIR